MKSTPHPIEEIAIIVPVFRGLEETRKCINSVLCSKNLYTFKLILINDDSPEPALRDYLRSLPKQDSRVELLENQNNIGFVKTVNKGMQHAASRDVVLLNSDTEVANDWLDRLVGAAYSAPDTGTVTPFSNNATICSFPRFCDSNALPARQDTASLDLLFKEANLDIYINIPTAVGFCMYIRRACLSSTGYFDEDHFGKGYGEENDFCVRASTKGWQHLLAANIFVFHSGGASFGDSKSPREAAAMETLRQLHPSYEPKVHRFVSDDPPRVARLRAEILRLQRSPAPRILAVLHNRGGGTLRQVIELTNEISSKAHVLSLYPADNGGVILALGFDEKDLKLYFNLPTDWDALLEVLSSLNIGLVHFHHTLGLPTQLWGLPKQLGCPHDFTVHDYYSICPQISLTGIDNQYCGELGVDHCNSCLAKLPAPGGVDIQTWRNGHLDLINSARFVFAPSKDTAHRFSKYYPNANIVLKPHTDLIHEPPIPNRPRVVSDRLRIAVFGALSPIKGADILESVARQASKSRLPIDFHLIGYGYRSLVTLPRANLIVYGKYEDSDLLALIDHINPDLVWFPALWPETYSYTLSAALEAGLPIVAPNLGAFPGRLGTRSWTWIQKWNQTPEEWIQFFQNLMTNFFATDYNWPENKVDCQSRDHDFCYKKEYLMLGNRCEVQPNLPSFEIRDHAYQRPDRLSESRQTILRTLVRLRNAPLLRHLARRIPMRWQTRVKTRLQNGH